MGGYRLMESSVFELTPAHIRHDFGTASFSPEWTITVNTSQLSNPVWLMRNLGYRDSRRLNLNLRSLGKPTFTPREYLSPAAREVKVKLEHSCTGLTGEPLHRAYIYEI